MKKRTEIQQDLKRGFGSAPTGIKKWVKWSAVGFVVYVAVRFVCAFVGGVVAGLGGSGFPHPCHLAHPFRFPLPLRACPFARPLLRDTLTGY